MFWFLTLVPTFGSSLWKKWRRSWLSLQRVKHLRSQTRLCRQTRHVALGCSQIYTQIAWEIHWVFFFPFVWVYMFLTCPLMSAYVCVCVFFMCVLENALCGDVFVSPRPPLSWNTTISLSWIFTRWGSWSLSIAGNLRLGTCLIPTRSVWAAPRCLGEKALGKDVEGKKDTTTEGKCVGLWDGRLNNACFYMLQLLYNEVRIFLRPLASCKSCMGLGTESWIDALSRLVLFFYCC